MSIPGIDTCVRIPDAKALYDKGIRFVCRYLVPTKAYDKAVTMAEAGKIIDAGLGLLLCWETSANRASEGAKAGTKDGETARKCAQELGVPENAAIYFAVDYRPPLHDYDAIETYLRTAAHACAPYGCGIYGPFDIVEEMTRRLPTLYAWQCVAWSDGKVSASADVYQYQWQGGPEAAALTSELGYAVDLDTCEDLQKAGMWLPDTSKPWYADAMAWASERGLIRDGRPNDPVTRAELALVLQRLCEGKEETYDPERNRPSGLLTDD